MMMKKSPGFALIEVLTALVILSVTMSALYLSFSTTVNGLVHLQDKTAAEWVALNTIAGIQLGIINADHGSAAGQSQMSGKPWNWTVIITTTEKSVSRITVEVRKPDKTDVIVRLNAYLRNDSA